MCTIPQTLSRQMQKGAGHETNQQLVGIERQLKQQREQETQQLRYVESISSGQQLHPDQQ